MGNITSIYCVWKIDIIYRRGRSQILKSKLGYELDKISYQKNYFIIIILTEKNECFFIESEKIKNKKDEIIFIIFNNRKYLIDKNYYEFVNQLSMQLYEDIFNECVTKKDKIIRI